MDFSRFISQSVVRSDYWDQCDGINNAEGEDPSSKYDGDQMAWGVEAKKSWQSPSQKVFYLHW